MPMAANIVKRDGRIEAFIPEKIAISCVRAGLNPDIAHTISVEVSKKVYQNMPTNEIRKLVAKWIAKYDKTAAKRYLDYGERMWSRPSPESILHRHRPTRRKQIEFGGKKRVKTSRLGKKKSGVGRPPR
ncbi:MAG: ATP cone domain-containing protein [Candidatus Aenigmatarchaeota archaeon]